MKIIRKHRRVRRFIEPKTKQRVKVFAIDGGEYMGRVDRLEGNVVTLSDATSHTSGSRAYKEPDGIIVAFSLLIPVCRW